jgi:hypothetical protein
MAVYMYGCNLAVLWASKERDLVLLLLLYLLLLLSAGAISLQPRC